MKRPAPRVSRETGRRHDAWRGASARVLALSALGAINCQGEVIHNTLTVGRHLTLDHPQTTQHLGGRLEFLSRRPTLHRDHLAAGLHEGKAPSRQLVESRHSTSSDIGGCQLSMELLSSPPMHRDIIEPELRNSAREPVGPALHRFDEVDVQVRSNQSNGNARQSGTRSDVDESGTGGEGVLNHGTVEDMSLPEDGHLAWTDEAVAHTGVSEDRREGLCKRKALTEESMSAVRCGWDVSSHEGKVSRETATRSRAGRRVIVVSNGGVIHLGHLGHVGVVRLRLLHRTVISGVHDDIAPRLSA